MDRQLLRLVGMGNLFGDLRLAIRRLRRSPGFTASALAILILSIGANSTIFAVVNHFLLEPLPAERSNELVSLNYRSGASTTPSFSYPDYRDLRDRNDVLAGLAGFTIAPVSASSSGRNGRSRAYLVTGNYFDVLGVKALMGRALNAAEDDHAGANPVVALSYGFWQRRFAGDPAVVGSMLKLNGLDYHVVGVLPEGFYGTERLFTPDLFVTIAMLPELSQGSSWLENRGARNVLLFGRLKPGVTATSAQAALSGVASQLAREFPAANEGMSITLSPVGLIGSALRAPLLAAGILLVVLAGGVLLVACANVAGLLLARAAGRRKEIAIRLAVGATRGALVREVLVESLLLSSLAAAGGLLLALWLLDLIAGLAPAIPVPVILNFEMDGRVLGLSALASLTAGLLCGIAPGLQSARVGVSETLKQHADRRVARIRMQDLLTGAQVALSTILLIGSLLVARSLQRTLEVRFGFEPAGAASVAVDLSLEGYGPDRVRTFRRDLIERVRALPGIESAALAGRLPLGLEQNRYGVYIEGEPELPASQIHVAGVFHAGEGYFRTMRTRLAAGREFEERDDTADVVIVNQPFVRNFLAGASALGKRVRTGPSQPWLEIVGVAEEGKYAWVNEQPLPVIFLPLARDPGFTTVVARAAGDSGALVGQLRSAVLALDPALSVFYDAPLAGRVAFQLLPSRFLAGSLGSFGLVALLLVSAGLYGILAYAVAQRTKEIGIRVALGAAPGSVVRMVVARAATIAAVGIVAGVGGGLALGKLFALVLYGIDPYDPLTICAAIAVMMLVGVLACWLPARRAARVDPLTALRAE